MTGLDGVDAVNKPPIPENNISVIRNTLHQINVLFGDVSKKQESEVYRSTETDPDRQMSTICNKIRGISTHRKSKAAKTNLPKKTR